MIFNKLCAYCRVEMNRTPNHRHGRSVEHMIPNASSIIKRNNGEGDFYVCRECNSNKSDIDELLGITTRLGLEGDSPRGDVIKFTERVNKGINKFIRTIKSVKNEGPFTSISIPIAPRKAINYFEFFGKGQYLINTGKVFDETKNIIIIDILGHSAIRLLEHTYTEMHKSNPFDDLINNPNKNLHNINGETFIICSDDPLKMIIFFNRVFLVSIDIVTNTRSNQTYKNMVRRRLHENWG